MTISEQHIMFRQYAQQMGMQNVRAITPEQIDVLLNVEIQETIDSIITKHVVLTSKNDNVTNTKIGQVNGLSTLYKTLVVNGHPTFDIPTTEQPFVLNKDSNVTSIVANISDLPNFNYLYLCDLHINYTTLDNKLTQYYLINIIEEGHLGETLNDYILKPTIISPIAVLVNNQIIIYIGDITHIGGINNVRISYIKRPAKVCYNSTDTTQNVDCDLPEHLHIAVVKRAVDTYANIISDTTSKVKQQSPYSNLLSQLINSQNKQ